MIAQEIHYKSNDKTKTNHHKYVIQTEPTIKSKSSPRSPRSNPALAKLLSSYIKMNN